jgi:hypothetical protein
MDGADEGNTRSQQDIIREDLKNVLKPYTPEQLNLSFLDAESYLDSLEERDKDPECADELAARSGYSEFVDTLNRFVEEKGITSKLTTKLYVIEEQLEKAIKELQPKSTDADIDALEENFMQQKNTFIEARGRMQRKVRDIYVTAASEVRDIGLEAANLLVEGCKQDEVELELGDLSRKAENIIKDSQMEAEDVIEADLIEIDRKLDVIENSEFSRNLKSSLSGKFEGLPEDIKKIITNAGSGFQKAGDAVLANAYKKGTQGGLKLTNFSGSNIHETVLNVGHKLGVKFKPWQATKITQGITVASQALAFFGVGLSIFMQIKDDQDEEQIRKELRDNRQNIRSQFNEAANELEDFSRQYIEEYVNRPLESSITAIDENIQAIRDTRTNRSETCRQLEDLQEECRLLIQDIYSENEIA